MGQAQPDNKITATGLSGQQINQKKPAAYFANKSSDPITGAFDKKLTIHAGTAGTPPSGDQQESLVKAMLSEPRCGQSALYIHVPFCESHCLYCGFFNKGYHREMSTPFTDAVIKEMDLWAHLPASKNGPVHAVYLGGGTPTALKGQDINRLLTAVKDRFPLSGDCEITVEGRIHNFDAQKMEECIRGGANRFSLGVQTFHTSLRQSMKRLSNRETIIDALKTLRSFDAAAVVIDLIFGFPGQTMDMWRRDIDDFLSLQIDGADFYQLNVFKNTPLGKAISKGTFPPAADIKSQAAMFTEAVQAMTNARYLRLSMSHWGRTTRERNIYNHMMKGPSHCLAFGPGGGGNLNGHFYFVDNRYDQWLNGVSTGEKPIGMITPSPRGARMNKTIAAGFDLGRINISSLASEFGPRIPELISPVIEQWEEAGLITTDNGWLELTLAGQFWHVNLAQLMIDFLGQQSIEEE